MKKIILNIKTNHTMLPIALIVIWAFYNFYILLKTGFVGDDAYNAQIKGAIQHQGISILDKIWSEAMGWTWSAGRIMIFNWYMIYGIFYLTQDPVIIKSFTIMITTLCFIYFFIFSKNETESTKIALLTTLLLITFIQFRFWHDPVLIFPSHLMPAIFLLFIASLVYYQKFLVRHDNKYLIISIVLYVISILCYETTVPLAIAFLIISLSRGKKIQDALKESKPYLMAALLYVLFVLYIKYIHLPIIKGAVNAYPTFSTFNFSDLISAFFIQLSSALPLSYYYLSKPNFALIFNELDGPILIVYGILLTYLFYTIATENKKIKYFSWFVIGFLILTINSFLIAISSHQKELIAVGYGFGYIVVFLQYFGMAIIILSIISILIRLLPNKHIFSKFIIFIIAVILGASFTYSANINLALNRAVALAGNGTYHYPREIIRKAAVEGLFKELKNQSYLFRFMKFPSDYQWSYTTFTSKILHTCEMADIDQKKIDGTDNYKDCIAKLKTMIGVSSRYNKKVESINLTLTDSWVLSYNYDKLKGENGRVILGKINNIKRDLDSLKLLRVGVNKIYIYDLKHNKTKLLELKKEIDFLNFTNEMDVDIKNIKYGTDL